MLQKLERGQFNVFGPQPLRLSKPHKLALIFSSWLRSAGSGLNYGSPNYGAAVNSALKSESRRRLIVNADDFGLSHSVNEAVIRAHREGILTTASLMVNEPGFDEAVELARKIPSSASACT